MEDSGMDAFQFPKPLPLQINLLSKFSNAWPSAADSSVRTIFSPFYLVFHLFPYFHPLSQGNHLIL